jgi:hypothetical protein
VTFGKFAIWEDFAMSMIDEWHPEKPREPRYTDLAVILAKLVEYGEIQDEEAAAVVKSWTNAADKILAVGGLSEREWEFVRDMRRRAERRAFPFSDKQKRWFRDIYLRVVGRPQAT